MGHKVDKFGRPINRELRELENELGILAGCFRGASGDDKQQHEIAAEYRAVFEKLYQLGWDDSLELESHLPDQYLPERYLKAHPIQNPFLPYDYAKLAREAELTRAKGRISSNRESILEKISDLLTSWLRK